MSVKGKILFFPLCSQGHVNYAISIAKRFIQLYPDQCDVYFLVNDKFKEKLEKICKDIKYVVYGPKQMQTDAQNKYIEAVQNLGKLWKEDTALFMIECVPFLEKLFDQMKSNYDVLTNIINEIKPDFIIFDQIFSIPVGINQNINQNIPFANLSSAAMDSVAPDSRIPPPESGLPTIYTSENSKLWQSFIDKAYLSAPFKKLKDEVNNFLKEKNAPIDLDDHYFISKASPYLNIYAYPKELDYREDGIEFESGKWMRIESPILKPYPEPFKIPEKFLNYPEHSKLIYFSLGTVASIYEPLMTKVLDILSQLNEHRFIISTGLVGERYKLADNMYGEKYLNQFAVLQSVDLVISHGGNNTLSESFVFAKPLIILPIYGDQFNNAQRIEDKKLGKRCNIFDPSDKLKSDLIDAIEYVSKESSIKERMRAASERIQNNSGLDAVCSELLKYAVAKK